MNDNFDCKLVSYSSGNEYVDKMDKLDLGTGYLIPATWFSTIKFESGKPNINAMLVLSDVVYWYKSSPVYDKSGEHIIGRKKRFKADLLQRSYSQIAEKFGFTKKQAISAVNSLESLGLIEKSLRTIKVNGISIPKVMFIKPNIDAIEKITYPDCVSVNSISEEDDLPFDAYESTCEDYNEPCGSDHVTCMSQAKPYMSQPETPMYEHIQDITQGISQDISQDITHINIYASSSDEPKSKCSKNKDIEDFFKSVWNLYPKKRGVGKVSLTRKKKLYSYGYEQIKRAIERYSKESYGKDMQYWKDGSTFFNSGIEDYLDSNYQEIPNNDRRGKYECGFGKTANRNTDSGKFDGLSSGWKEF